MQTSPIQALYPEPMLLGECPLWHPEEKVLYWVDIAGHAVHCHDPATDRHRSWKLPAEPGCIAWCDGGLVVAMRSGFALLDTVTGSLTTIAEPPYDPAVVRFNDGRCDAHGRLWAGTLYEPRDHPGGSLFCLERGVIRDAGKVVTVSNGLAFSKDARTLYHADTAAHRITAWEYDLTRGEIGSGRLFHQFSKDRTTAYGGRPDGAAVDSEDAYWCAMYEGGRVLRLSPRGDVMSEITLPARCPTMVAFGGDDLRTLFITTARRKRPDQEIAQYPLSGCVLMLRLDIPGRIEPSYRL